MISFLFQYIWSLPKKKWEPNAGQIQKGRRWKSFRGMENMEATIKLRQANFKQQLLNGFSVK